MLVGAHGLDALVATGLSFRSAPNWSPWHTARFFGRMALRLLRAKPAYVWGAAM